MNNCMVKCLLGLVLMLPASVLAQQADQGEQAYSPHLRVTLLEGPEGVQRFRAAIDRMRFLWDEGAPVDQPAWIHLGEQEAFQQRGVASVGLRFESLDGKPFDRLHVRVDLAYAPHEEAILATITHETPGHIIGLYIPRARVPRAEAGRQFRLIREDILDRNAYVKSLNLPPVDLKHYYIEAHLRGFGTHFSDPGLVDIDVDTIRTIGFNALDSQYAGLATVYREAAARHGIFQTHHTIRHRNMDRDPETGHFILDWDRLRRNIDEGIKARVDRLRQEDPDQLPLIRFIDIGDEIEGYVFGGPEYDEAYRAYLREQGVTPQEVGRERWEDVKPDALFIWRQARINMPKDRTDAGATASYYWTVRFWSWVNARVFRMNTDAVEKHLGVTSRINFGPPWAYEYGNYQRGTEMWDFARERSAGESWNEDWLNTRGQRHSGIQLNAFLMDLNRSLALLHGLESNAMVMPEEEPFIQIKMASVVGKGGKKLDLYRYGPAYASGDNWSQRRDMVRGVANFIRELAKVEEVLHPGQPPQSEVAIIWSSSNRIWNEHNADMYNVHYLYFALQHRQIPVDFVDEIGVAQGRLKDYKVAILSDRHLRRDTQQALARWVEEGGRLWVDGVGGLGDEYSQRSDLLLPVLGIAPDYAETWSGEVSEERAAIDWRLPYPGAHYHMIADYTPHTALPEQPSLGQVALADADDQIEAIGVKVAFKVREPDKAQVLGVYEDGSPAIIEQDYGRGRVRYVGTMAGLSYARPLTRERSQLQRGFREQERRVLTDFVLAAGVRQPVISSVPVVEASRLHSEAGTAVVLVNYTGQPQEAVELLIDAPTPVSRIHSAARGELEFSQESGRVKVTVPLELFDFVILQP